MSSSPTPKSPMPPTDEMNDKFADEAAPDASVAEFASSPDSLLVQGEAQSGNWDSVELQRISTYRLQQQQTVGNCQDRPPKEQWLPLGAGKPYPASLPDPEDYVVEFEGADDPMHPQNWEMRKKFVARRLFLYRGEW